jgi:sugar phosphate permease
MATIGNMSSRINLKYFIGLGLILSAFCYMSFSFAYLATNSYSFLFIVISMCLNGFFQSTGWPGVMGIVGNWFGKGKRGLLMGFWGINANVGNIIALVLCNILDQSNKLPWTYNFIVTGCFTVGIGVSCILFLK